jgi:hypothetical protein
MQSKKGHEVRDVGNGLLMATPEAVREAIGKIPADLSWSFAQPRVLPMLPRRRPMPPGTPPIATADIGPLHGISFGIDIGPGALVVGEAVLASFGCGISGLRDAALRNARERLSGLALSDVERQRVNGTDVRLIQAGTTGASALLFFPDALAKLIGASPALLIAPMRDLLVAIAPGKYDFAMWLAEELSVMDPNGQLPSVWSFTGSAVTPSGN